MSFKGKKIVCLNCKKSFIQRQPNNIFCTPECCKKNWKKKFEEASKGIIKKSNGKSTNYYRLRFEVFKRDNFTCQYCGRNVKEDKIKLHADHVIPIKKGGKTTFSNLITSCEECNLGKGDILLTTHQNKP